MGLPGLAERALTGQGSTVIAQRVFPLLVAIVIILLITFSTISPTLLIVKGTLAELVALAYAALLIALTIAPHWDTGHKWGAPLGVAVFSSRAGGFLDRAVNTADWEADWTSSLWWFGPDPTPFATSWVLLANSLERLAFAMGMVLWHRARVRDQVPLHP